MKRVLLLTALMSLTFASFAVAQTPVLSLERLSVGLRFGHEWTMENASGTSQFSDYRVELPLSYSLPTSVPASLSIKAGKFLSRAEVRYDVFLTVALVHKGRVWGTN